MELKNIVYFGADRKFRRGSLSTDGARFGGLSTEGEAHFSDGDFLIPGMVDIHTHGAAGFDTCDGTALALEKMSEFYISKGVTSFCATSMTYDEATLTKVMSTVAEFEHEGGARCLGINMEGPFIASSKKGAQNGEYICAPDWELFCRLNAAANGKIKLVDVAPETQGALDFIRKAAQVSTVSVAHTAADFDEAAAAFRAGASHLTHTFNAMNPLLHRAPGPIGAAADFRAFAELICDGIHIHPSAIRAAFRIFGEDRLCVISDSMRCAGLSDGEYELGGQPVYVNAGKATLADGTIAGSSSNLYAELKNLISFGIEPEVAVASVTLNPACSIGMEGEVGSIAPGRFADMVLMSPDWNIKAVWRGGVEISL